MGLEACVFPAGAFEASQRTARAINAKARIATVAIEAA